MRLAFVALLALAACVDPNASIDLMKGQGSASTAPDGQRSFRFVIPANAYSGLISDPAQLSEQHELMLAQWAATGCPDGYSVASRTVTSGMVVYSGPCR